MFTKNNTICAITIFTLIVVSFILKLSMANYGNPYLFHPDEPYIYKDAFKQLYLISEGDFSFVTNPYNILLSIWYAICFPFGKLFGLWVSFADYKQQVIAESFNVIYIGRIFSFLISATASLFLFKYFIKNHNNFNKVIIAFFIFFNPIEWISNFWIKFDPICYLTNVIILIQIFKYTEGKITAIKLGFWLGLAFAVRMDFVSYIVGVGMLMFLKKISRPTLNDSVKLILVALLTYLITTNLLLHVLLSNLSQSAKNIDTNEGFIVVFIDKIKTFTWLGLVTNVKNNTLFYVVVFVITSLPLLLYDFFYLKFKTIKSKEVILLQLFLVFILLIFSYSAPHYFLVTQVCYLIFLLKDYVAVVKTRSMLFVFIACIIWNSTLAFEIVYYINFVKDTRLEASDYVIKNTLPNDIIAIEGYQNVGLVPTINECSEQFLAKAAYIKKAGLGTGKTFEAKAMVENKNCRKIIEVDVMNRFGSDSSANSFVNTYDIKLLKKYKPAFFVTTENKNSKFYSFIKEHTVNVMNIEQNYIDPRMYLFRKEPFNISFIVHKLNL